MAYSAAILARAKARLAAAREQNAQDDAARIGAIYERLPRLRQIDLELQKTAAKVCAAAFRAGEDPSETIRQLKDENLRLQQERDWILESEGVDPDDLEQTAVCPRCGGSGYLGARMCECLAELCRQEQQKFRPREGEDVTRKYLACDLLILDDLGTEMTTQFTIAALYQVVNTRLMESRATIVSTNLPVGELDRRYSAQIASRLLGAYTLYKFSGKDIRMLQKSMARPTEDMNR